MLDLAVGDGRPQVADELLGMEAGVDDAVILAEQLFPQEWDHCAPEPTK